MSDRTLQLITPFYMRGEDVRWVQNRIGAGADAVFGPGTKAAVQNFQRVNGLHDDGIVGPLTWAKMRADYGQMSPRPARAGAFIAPSLSEIEFADRSTNVVMWDPRIPAAWTGLRREVNRPITGTSGYRTPQHNAEVGGQPNSLHLKGMAFDMVPPAGYNLDTFAQVVAKHFGTAIIERKQGVVHGEVGTNRGVIVDGRY